MRFPKVWFSFPCFAGVFVLLQQSDVMNAYVLSIKQEAAAPVQSHSEGTISSEQLLEEIKQEAAKRKIEPIDAKVDRVWRLIPGYNGRAVDIKTTYRFALKYGDDYPFFYQEITPNIQMQDLMPAPIYKGNPNKPMVSIMINVAWGNEYIPDILKTLKESNVKATFFFDGSWLRKNNEMALKIVSEGHEASNHGYSHKDMSTLDRQSALEEMKRTQQLLKEVLHVDNLWFAPPSGDYNQETVELAHGLGLKTVLWTVDTVDWKDPSPAWIVNRISSRIEPGAMILMHPTEASSKALPEMIQVIKQKGLHMGTVSELLSPKRLSVVEHTYKFW